ncbi:hypothetical protein CBS147347_10856 [Aspergillus niger]|nr:hypothetical protein CBS147347_10856 [Aspergillus niger]
MTQFRGQLHRHQYSDGDHRRYDIPEKHQEIGIDKPAYEGADSDEYRSDSPEHELCMNLGRSTQRDWLQEERDLDDSIIQRRQYDDDTIRLQKRVWELWCRFCAETKRDALELLKADPPSLKTLHTFFDYTVTTRRRYIKAASTLQTYWNIWTQLRREKTGLTIPSEVKNGMVGVRDQLTKKHKLRTESKEKPILRSEDVFELLKVLWTTATEPWDPVQLALIILLAGITGQRPGALVSLKHADVAITLFPTGRERPHMVLEVKPRNTKGYRGKKKPCLEIGIPEVPSEPCLLFCPKTLFLGLLIRKSAFRHLHISSARQLYALQVSKSAGSLTLRPADPDAHLFDISARTLNSWLKRLGEITGFDLPITPYWLRRGAGEAANSSCEISEAQQNLLLQHASGSVYQKNYRPDYLPVDFNAAWRQLKPQVMIIRMASGQSRSIDRRRPIDLSGAEEIEARANLLVRRRLKCWLKYKQKIQRKHGTLASAAGTPLYAEAMKQRTRYYTALQASRREMKEKKRSRFNEEQPVQDVIRQVHGLPLETYNVCDDVALSQERRKAIVILFRFAPTSEQDETNCRIAAVDAVSQIDPSLKSRLRAVHSSERLPGWTAAGLAVHVFQMAPSLAASQLELIRGMILSRSLTTAQMADVAGCNERSIRYMRSNLRFFGSVRAPPNKAGRPRTVAHL